MVSYRTTSLRDYNPYKRLGVLQCVRHHEGQACYFANEYDSLVFYKPLYAIGDVPLPDAPDSVPPLVTIGKHPHDITGVFVVKKDLD